MRKHNLTGRLTALFIDSKLTLVLILAALIFGLYAVLTTPREENPQISMPAAVVQVLLPGASPEEVEAQLVRPLEALVNQIPGVDHVTAVAADSAAVLSVQFEVGEEKEPSLVKLSERLLGGRGALPREAVGPFIRSADADDVPILALSLISREYDDAALKTLGLRMLDELQSLEGISSTYVVGGRSNELRIRIDPKRLQNFGIGFDDIKNAVLAANVAGPIGRYVEPASVSKTGGLEANVRVEDFIASKTDLENLVVAARPGRTVLLSDVADIEVGPDPEPKHLSRFGFGRASAEYGEYEKNPEEYVSVTLAIAKKKGANAVTVADEVLARVERMKASFVPKAVEVVVTRNDGVKANDAVNVLIGHLGIAVAAVVSVTWAFLGFRAALIVAVTVPLILAITLGMVNLAGLTINRLTLYGLIIALGLLVDDSIVVIENIVRHYRLGPMKDREERLRRTVDAPDEIGNATLLATIAVMLVFASLIPSLSGMPKQYFFPVGFSVPVALAASFFVAYVVAPWAAVRWIPDEKPKTRLAAKDVKDGENPSSEPKRPGGVIGRIYCRFAEPLLGHPKREACFLLLIVALLALSSLMPFWQLVRPEGPGGPVPPFGVEMGFLPKDNKNTFNVTVKMPDGTPVEVTDRVVRDVAEHVRAIPEVVDYQTWSGLSGVADFNSMIRGDPAEGSNIGAVRVNLLKKDTGRRSSILLTRELRVALKSVAARYPGADIQVVEDPPGPPLKASILAEIYMHDQKALEETAAIVRRAFEDTYDMMETTDSVESDVPMYRLRVDREKAILAGVVPAKAAEALKRLVEGEVVGYAHKPGEREPQAIRIDIPNEFAFDPKRLDEVFVPGALGKDVALSSIVRVEKGVTDHKIVHKDGVRMAWVGGELGSTTPTYAVLDLQHRLNGMTLPTGGTLKGGNLTFSDERADLTANEGVLLWQGENRMMLDSYRDLVKALALSIGSIFLILVAYYRSFGLALIALAAVPLAFIGLFPGHWLFGAQFSASSLIGVVALAGVVVRNSLLIIDFVRDYLKAGLPLEEAAMDAGAVRLRPILLTTLAIIFGSVVMITDPVFSGLAISFIFGTAASTVFTVFLIPILLTFYYKRWPYKPDATKL